MDSHVQYGITSTSYSSTAFHTLELFMPKTSAPITRNLLMVHNIYRMPVGIKRSTYEMAKENGHLKALIGSKRYVLSCNGSLGTLYQYCCGGRLAQHNTPIFEKFIPPQTVIKNERILELLT